MTRLFVLTFHGPKRWTDDIKQPHESPPVMTVPLILLAVGSVAAGALMATPVKDWLDPGLRCPPARRRRRRRHLSHTTVTMLSMVVTVLGVAARLVPAVPQRAPRCRSSRPVRWSPPPARTSTATRVNEAVFEKPGKYLTRALVYFDNKGIDGLVNGLAAAVGGGSGPAASGADRVRALVRPVHARRRAAGRGRVPRGEARVSSDGRLDFPYLSLLTGLPLLGALVVALLPRDRPGPGPQVALVWSLAVLGPRRRRCGSPSTPDGPRFQLRESYPWIPTWDARFTFAVDGIALVMIALIAVFVPLVVLYSWNEAAG